MRRFSKAVSTVLLAGLVLAGCSTNNNNNQNKNENNQGTANKQSNNNKNNKAGQNKTNNTDFPLFGYDYQQTRHVPFKKITKDNVKKLGVVWQQDLLDWDSKLSNFQEDYPVVKDGVIYVASAKNHVFAIDAKSGKKKWEWKPPKKVLDHINGSQWQANVASRGVAVHNGNVFVLIVDNRIAKLDAKTGKLKKMNKFWDYVPELKMENRHYESMAPIYYKGNIYVGSSGGDNGARGYVMAFKASNLKPAWDEPFWTIPQKGKGWRKGKYTGGGSVWMPMSFDKETDMMYFGVANPSPDYYDKKRPGNNKHTDSVVALDSKTGKLKWAATQVGHDVWDYDAAAPPMILKAKVNGKKQKIVVEGGKNGKWYAWDAKSGKNIYDGVPFVKIKNSKQSTTKAKLQWPGYLGGENYAPETYDPSTNYVLIPGINQPANAIAAKNPAEVAKKNNTFPGTKNLPVPKNIKPSGNITAIDVNTGKKKYQVKTNEPMRGGLTSTASGLAFYGELSGKVNALDVKSGKVLWTMKSGGKQIKMAPTVYVADGKEYIAVLTGGTNLVVYGLGGKKPSEVKQHKGNMGKSHGNEQATAKPKQIFKQNCASCHGENLQGKSGPNLQHVGKDMTKKDILNQIKNGGGRMPGGIIKGKQADAVAQWLSKKK